MEDGGVGEDASDNGSCACRMCADVVPGVDDDAYAVDEKADDNDCAHKVGQVHVLAEAEAAKVADNLDDICDGSVVLQVHLVVGPSVDALYHLVS